MSPRAGRFHIAQMLEKLDQLVELTVDIADDVKAIHHGSFPFRQLPDLRQTQCSRRSPTRDTGGNVGPDILRLVELFGSPALARRRRVRRASPTRLPDSREDPLESVATSVWQMFATCTTHA
jgi:hypothetical protein